ncbi:MAG: hypothetical protein V3T86_05685 [Planctomycetota bacterium]
MKLAAAIAILLFAVPAGAADGWLEPEAGQVSLESSVEGYLADWTRDPWAEDEAQRPGPEDEWVMHLDVGVWAAQLRGPIRKDGDDIGDWVDELGVDSFAAVPTVRFQATRDDWTILVSAYWAEWDGSAETSKNLDWPGVRGGAKVLLPAGTPIDSRLRISKIQFLVGPQLIGTSRTKLRVFFGLVGYDVDLRLDPRSNNETIAADAFVPAPTIGIGAYGRISKRWSWEVELFGFGISIDTFGISIIDARLAIGYNVSAAIALRLGYRATALSILVDGYEVDVSLDGGFFELRWSF